MCCVIFEADWPSIICCNSISKNSCACGGGFKVGECNDFPGWIDSHSHYPYTCDQYESAEACDDGEAYFNFGLNGRTACCICGKKILVSTKELLSIPDL